MLLHRDRAVLVVVDVQGRILPVMHDADAVALQIERLIQGFRLLGAPILVTEQYRKGLGETDPRLVAALGEPARPAIEKMSFSCMMEPVFRAALEETRRRQVVLCGIEAHVCVHQTALHLLEAGYEVQIAADAVSSRSPRNRDIALDRLSAEGVKLTTVETAIFEMLEVCGTDAFKAWVKAIR